MRNTPGGAARTPSRSERGQSLVEFALVLPMLLVLLLGIADLGRVFSAGITIEAAARNAAEIAAEEYLNNPPGAPAPPLMNPAPQPGDPDYNGNTYYPALHRVAAQAACDELRILPNAGYDPATRTCSAVIVQVCVDDQADPDCGTAPAGFPNAASMPRCGTANASPLTNSGSAEQNNLRYVEVRICYRFTTLVPLKFSLPFGWGLDVGDIYLERTRSFTVANW